MTYTIFVELKDGYCRATCEAYIPQDGKTMSFLSDSDRKAKYAVEDVKNLIVTKLLDLKEFPPQFEKDLLMLKEKKNEIEWKIVLPVQQKENEPWDGTKPEPDEIVEL